MDEPTLDRIARLPTTIPMPQRIARLPRDPRGYPILASITRPDGGYDFRGTSAVTAFRLAQERLCGVCGEPLNYWICFIGGPLAIKNRVFSDPAMHPECAIYSVAVCPYLAYQRTPRQLTTDNSALVAELDAESLVGHIDAKPDRVGIGRTRSYQLLRTGHIKAGAFVEVTWIAPRPGRVDE